MAKCWLAPSFIFLLLYFIDYAITVVLVLIFPLCSPPPSTPHSLKQSPHHCSCPWVMNNFFGYSISYMVLYIPMAILEIHICTSFLKYILLIMPLQLSHFPSFIPLCSAHPLPLTFPPLVHIHGSYM